MNETNTLPDELWSALADYRMGWSGSEEVEAAIKDFAAQHRQAYETDKQTRELKEALKACVDALAMLRANGVYVWPNHPENPEAKGRKALGL